MNTIQGLDLQKRMREFDEEHGKDDKSMRRVREQRRAMGTSGMEVREEIQELLDKYYPSDIFGEIADYAYGQAAETDDMEMSEEWKLIAKKSRNIVNRLDIL